MAETSGKGGLGWLWPALSFMVLIGAFVIALAYLFPQGIEFSQPVETAPLEAIVPQPIEDEVLAVKFEDVLDDPSRYIGKRVFAIVRVSDIVTDRILWLGSREYWDGKEMFAVVAEGIDLEASDFRIWQLVKLYGTIRPFQEEDLKSQGLEIGRRIRAAMATEKGYLLIEGLIANNPDPRQLIEEEEEAAADPEQAQLEEQDQSQEAVEELYPEFDQLGDINQTQEAEPEIDPFLEMFSYP